MPESCKILQFPREIIALKEEREEERRIEEQFRLTMEEEHELTLKPVIWHALSMLGQERVASILQKLLAAWSTSEESKQG